MLYDRVKWSVILFVSVLAAFYCGRASFNLLLTSFFFVGSLEWTLLCDKMPKEKYYILRIFGYFVLIVFWLSSHWLYVRNQGMLLNTLLHVFASDIGGYVGGQLGPQSYKLWPSISPSKTIAGSLMCLLFSVLGTQITRTSIQFSLFVSVCAQIGDLFESKAKRLAEVKDSNLEILQIPGHGGVLDRLDGIILTVPAVCAIKVLTQLKGY